MCWDICMRPPCTSGGMWDTPIPRTPYRQNRKGSALCEFLSPSERRCCVNRRIGSCLQVKQSRKIGQSFLPCKSVSHALPHSHHPRAKKRLLWRLFLSAFGLLGLYHYWFKIFRYTSFPGAGAKVDLSRGLLGEGKVVAGLAWANIPALLNKQRPHLVSLPACTAHRLFEVFIPMGICPMAIMPLLKDNFTGVLRHW